MRPYWMTARWWRSIEPTPPEPLEAAFWVFLFVLGVVVGRLS